MFEEYDCAKDFSSVKIVEEDTYVEEDASEEKDGSIGEGERAFTEREIDEIADCAVETIQNILHYFNLGDITIDEYDGEDGELILDISGEDLALLIGKHGKTLDALQHIVSLTTIQKLGFKYPIVVDVEGYKSRQRQALERMARSTADKVARFGSKIKLRPMTPYERRIIHIALRNDDRVYTESEGEDLERAVVVFPNI